MSSSFELFKKQLDGAVSLIESSSVGEQKSTSLPPFLDELEDTKSLLARCEGLCEKYAADKPIIRIIHHLACSGGTLFSKCLSAMPNVYLLSEVHPYSQLSASRPHFAPSDIAMLSKFAGVPNQKKLAAKVFTNSIKLAYEHVEQCGGTLVLRDHTHSDFNTESPVPLKSEIVSLLESEYEIKSVLTIRDPLDSFTSLKRNGWMTFEPQSFDEYCRRLLLLLKQHAPSSIFKYEEFVESPELIMKKICDALALPYDESFVETFGVFDVTGDSGRTSDVIGERIRDIPEALVAESQRSENYEKICKLMITREEQK
ncbi:sulfotransferase [Alteromonas sp. BMJM2]|uniref:sulfotransferase n=1 Tax=Alteromonas sp. BMJM2 TaxID=2954241 RepID=UPI0022B5227F|nr:sulfotransferase [Alteromonas sp. BMJM2]